MSTRAQCGKCFGVSGTHTASTSGDDGGSAVQAAQIREWCGGVHRAAAARAPERDGSNTDCDNNFSWATVAGDVSVCGADYPDHTVDCGEQNRDDKPGFAESDRSRCLWAVDA
ncbi:hypothetical protein FQR65_LT20505 [Abscondita terminalis]|nr:hypothetical protein FQR65_LT20505 [Abscondita terminalis]